MGKQNTSLKKPALKDVTPEKLYNDFLPSNQYTQSIWNKPVVNDKIKTNKYAGNSKFLPISVVEAQLDEIFFGLWQTRNIQYSVVANEILCTLELWVFHPILKEWIVRTGAGAAMIQQDAYKKDEDGNYMTRAKKDGTGVEKIKINPRPTDADYKIKNTLVKDFPHAKAEAFKNAAKSIGKYFGRDLNRSDVGHVGDSINSISQAAKKKELSDAAFQSACQLIKDGKQTAAKIKDMFALSADQLQRIDSLETETA